MAGLARLEVRGDGDQTWLDMGDEGGGTLALRGRGWPGQEIAQETEIEKGGWQVWRRNAVEGARPPPGSSPWEVTEGLGEGVEGLRREEAETASQPECGQLRLPLDCKREWRRKEVAVKFLSDGETEQVFRLGVKPVNSGLGKKVRMPEFRRLGCREGGRGGACGGGSEERAKKTCAGGKACGR